MAHDPPLAPSEGTPVPPPDGSAGAVGSTDANAVTEREKRRARRNARPHPYATEASTPAELRRSPGQVTAFWFGLATLMAVVGLMLDRHYNPDPQNDPNPQWAHATLVPLFSGLALLAFGFVRSQWSKNYTMVGWLLFASYWGLTAFDLLYAEGQDYVNFVFALVGVYFFTYLAYHQWLSLARGVDNEALHFLNSSTFVAAGAYFLIDKVEPIQKWLIGTVSDQTNYMLGLFGQQTPKGGLVYHFDPSISASVSGPGPAQFWYQATRDTCPDGTHLNDFWVQHKDYVAQYQATHGTGGDPIAPFRQWCADQAPSFIHGWGNVLHYAPDHDHIISTVSIILACTALQSIMLFVGLVVGARARWQDKLLHSVWVGLLVYLLNLLRNTGIIWFYGQGKTSFWVMHNAVGKGGSLVAMVGIAFILFRVFPPFFTGLVSVLDLPERDGPVERTLRIGRRRPSPASEPVP